MKINARKMILIIMIVFVLVAVCSATAFALLIHETKVDSSVVFGEIAQGATDFVLSADKELSFAAAKQVESVNMIVRNNSDIPLDYRYEISVTSGNGLENAILVSVKGDFIGALGAGTLTADGGTLYPKNGAEADEISDLIELELHNGAVKSYADKKNCTVNIRLVTETVDYGKSIFVSDADTLKKAIDDVNSGGGVKTLRIIGDVAIQSDVTIENAVNLDFSKGKLIYNGFKMIFNGLKASDGGIIGLRSERGAYTDGVNSGKPILVSSAKLAVNISDSCASIGGLIELSRFNERAAASLIAARAREKLSRGVASGASVDILGSLSIYSGKITLSRSGSGDTGFIVSGGGLDTLASERTVSEILSLIGSDGAELERVSFKIFGASDNDYESVITDAFKHLYALTADKGAELNADIYLPTSVPKYNMSVAWSSDKPNILDNSGAVSADGEGEVNLTAYIEINGDVTVRQLTFTVFKQNNQMRFDYLVARIGEKRLTALYTADSVSGDGSSFTLPIVSAGSADDYRAMYGIRNIGLESLSYQLDVNADYLSLFGGNTVALIEPTFDTSTDVTIRGIFKNEPKKIYEAIIHVEIEPIDDVKLHNEIVDYVQGLLNNIDILENILSTRAEHGMALEKGDFILPSKYKIYTLSYSLSDAAGNGGDSIISGISENTGADGLLSYLFAVNAARFDIKGRRVRFYVNIEMTNKNSSSIPKTSSPIYVDTPGALHFGGDNASGTDSLTKGAAAIADSDVFYSLKLQVIHALKGERGVPIVGGAIDSVLASAIAPNYILLRDLDYLKTLYIVCDSASAYSAASDAVRSIDSNPYLGLPVGSFTVGGALNAEAYGILGYAVKVETLYIAAVNGAESIYNAGDAEAVLEYFTITYSSLKSLTMRGSGLKNAAVIGEISGIEYIDLRDNAELNAFAWLSSLKNPRVKYINVSGTTFSSGDAGIFDALYYRCRRADASITPRYYFTGADGVETLYIPTEGDNLLLSHLLYSLNGAEEIKTQYLQLKPTLYDGANEYTVNWSIKGAVDNTLTVDGVNIAAITAVNPLRLENLLLTSDGTLTANYKQIVLSASVTNQKGDITITREFNVKAYYYTA